MGWAAFYRPFGYSTCLFFTFKVQFLCTFSQFNDTQRQSAFDDEFFSATCVSPAFRLLLHFHGIRYAH
jgi:hypothetical protein